MQRERSEYILKGIFLGLIMFVALQNPDWGSIASIGLWMAGGLGLTLLMAVIVNIRDLSRLLSKPIASIIFLVLESPFLVYAGILFGLVGGAVAEKPVLLQNQTPADADELRWKLLLYCVGGGAILGYGFGELRQIRQFRYRFVLSLLVSSLLVTAIWLALEEGNLPIPIPTEDRPRLGVLLLLSIPFFYLLTFTGIAEESEVEIAMICGVLGIGIYLTNFAARLPALGFLLPITLYFIYSTRILNGLRVFKHVVRGFCYLRLNKIKYALRSARRALVLDKKSQLASQLMVAIHHEINLDEAANDPELLELLDLNRCINRVTTILMGSKDPTPAQLEEVHKLLNLIQQQMPQYRSHVDYYRSVAFLKEGRHEEAAELLNRLLDPTQWESRDSNRKTILYPAWQLALVLHPEMRRRVGDQQLDLPGRRIELLQAVERQLGGMPDDSTAQNLRTQLYDQLLEEDYRQAAGNAPLPDFDYGHIGQHGATLIETNNWMRGAEYLRIVAHGNPTQAPSILRKLAEVCERHNRPEESLNYLLQVKQIGIDLGYDQLPSEPKQAFFAVIKQLADRAASQNDWEEAIQDYSIYTHFESSGKETLRTLAGMYENKKDVFEALRVLEKIFQYSGTKEDKDLLARKDRYYYSLDPNILKERKDQVKGYFDVTYCVRKAKEILDSSSRELETLDWAEHLIQLALVIQPKNIIALVQQARCHIRRQEDQQALKILEDVRGLKPSGNDETDARYFGIKQLGMMYLENFVKPDFAVECFLEYQQSNRSGADTYYNLGRAYEALGDNSRALQQYRMVMTYEEHPLRWDAQQAIDRIKGGVGTSS
jgi:tetratricopeptide (TPR) repeat protein